MKNNNKDTFIRRQIFLDDFADFPLRYGGWAISEDYAYDLVQYAMIHRPKVVLDLGTGTTTALLGKVAEELKKAGHDMRVISVDSDEKWLVDTKKILETMKVDEFVELVYAPIIETEKGKYYDPQKVFTAIGVKKIDLLTIDGPPGSTQKEARYPAMPFFKKFLSDDAVVLLDDGGRKDERVIAERWGKEFPEWEFEYKPYMKGGFVAYKKESHQINPIISNHLGIIDYDDVNEEIFESVEKIFNNLSKFEKQLENKERELARKTQELEDSGKELARKTQELEDSGKELARKTQELEDSGKELARKTQELEDKNKEMVQKNERIIKFSERIKKLETSKSYRLGDLFFRSIKRPYKILTFPVNVMMILLEKKKINDVSNVKK